MITVKSRKLFEQDINTNGINNDIAYISILDATFDDNSINIDNILPDESNTMTIRFDDSCNSIDDTQPFTDDDADVIYKFIVSNLDRGTRDFIVHCSAGIARSAAVSMFIQDIHQMIFENEDKLEISTKQSFHPNPLVTSICTRLLWCGYWDEIRHHYLKSIEQ